MKIRSQTTAYILLLLVPLFWGGAFGTTKHVLTELPPLTASAIRFLLAGILMTVLTVWRGEWNWRLIRQNYMGLAGLGITGAFLYNYFFATGLQYTSSVTGALVIVVNPVITACMAALLLGESWSWRTSLGVTISLVGVLFIITQGNIDILKNQSLGIGETLLLGAVASWSSYSLLGKIVMRKMGALLTTTVSTLGGAVLLLGASLTENSWSKIFTLSGQTMLELVYLIVFATVVAFVLYNWGIQRIGATKASAYINLMPVNALWIGVCIYGETVSMIQLIGMAFIMIGVYSTTQAPSPSKPAVT